MAAALLIQIGTNLANDYYDFVSGADTHDRLGPVRVTQAGWISPHAVKAAAFTVLGLAAVLGLFLVWYGGWVIAVIGVLSLISAVAYTAGPYPLAYHGLGDPFVFVFFGLIAVNGTTYLQTGRLDSVSLLASIPVACLATAILVVNNLRDIPTDARSGKRTLAVRMGPAATRAEYMVLVAVAFIAPLLVASVAGWPVLLVWLLLPLAVRETRALYNRSGGVLNQSLAGTARLHLLYGLLLAIGLVV